VRALTAKGHPFDICVLPQQLHLADALAKSCPNAQFVLDHCGVPAIASQALSPWREGIAALAANPNVACKISGVIAYGDVSRWGEGDVGAVVRDLRPYVEHVIASFGWERVVWGSDFPVCNLTRGLTTWKAATDELLAACSVAQLDALAFGNARRIYRLPC
jgi:predicted TIM-barrel fold metal-dependent hydrolase